MMGFSAKAFKYYEYLVTKASKAIREHTFTFGDEKVRYIFEPHKGSQELVVVFSACTRVGVKARYNYMRTLHDAPCNRLFILDDGGPDHRGSYYLGTCSDYGFKVAVAQLIERVCEGNHIEHATYVGSSKGGWAALLFGMECDLFDIPPKVIAGAPQYWLGRYLDNRFPGSEVPSSTLDGICGVYPREDAVAELDGMLRRAIASNTRISHQEIVLHYSEQDHTYGEHIADLKRDLERAGAHLRCDVAHYADHGEVSVHFPRLLKTEFHLT